MASAAAQARAILGVRWVASCRLYPGTFRQDRIWIVIRKCGENRFRQTLGEGEGVLWTKEERNSRLGGVVYRLGVGTTDG